jgi:hypothetical protein
MLLILSHPLWVMVSQNLVQYEELMSHFSEITGKSGSEHLPAARRHRGHCVHEGQQD